MIESTKPSKELVLNSFMRCLCFNLLNFEKRFPLDQKNASWIEYYGVATHTIQWKLTHTEIPSMHNLSFSVFERIFRCTLIVSEVVIDGNIVILSRVGFFFCVGFLEISRVLW